MAQIKRFVTVTQRKVLDIDAGLFPLFEHIFEIETHMSFDERTALIHTSLGLPGGFVACEVGSYVGASSAFIATSAKLKGGHLHCVDTWDNRAMGAEAPRDTYAEFIRNTEHLSSFITTHRGQSQKVASQVPSDLHLLLLDGDHSYAATLADVSAYARKVRRGGLVLFHDFRYERVERAATEYFAAHPAEALRQVDSMKAFRVL